MSNRASFIFGRALPLGVFGFLVAIQGELAFAGVQHALTHGDLDRAGIMYLLNRILTVAFSRSWSRSTPSAARRSPGTTTRSPSRRP